MNVEFNFPNPVNRDLLIEEITLAGYPEYNTGQTTIIVRNIQSPDVPIIEALIAAHNASVPTTAQSEAVQAETAFNALKLLTAGLHGLSANDKGYALYCRLLAWRDGASNPVINAIVDRPTAVAYVTAKPEWVAATAATRALLADILEADAALCMVLLLVL